MSTVKVVDASLKQMTRAVSNAMQQDPMILKAFNKIDPKTPKTNEEFVTTYFNKAIKDGYFDCAGEKTPLWTKAITKELKNDKLGRNTSVEQYVAMSFRKIKEMAAKLSIGEMRANKEALQAAKKGVNVVA